MGAKPCGSKPRRPGTEPTTVLGTACERLAALIEGLVTLTERYPRWSGAVTLLAVVTTVALMLWAVA
jgi:Na+-translocating ferredoxin:NAD+ oxidoreductase RnfD subunit